MEFSLFSQCGKGSPRPPLPFPPLIFLYFFHSYAYFFSFFFLYSRVSILCTGKHRIWPRVAWNLSPRSGFTSSIPDITLINRRLSQACILSHFWPIILFWHKNNSRTYGRLNEYVLICPTWVCIEKKNWTHTFNATHPSCLEFHPLHSHEKKWDIFTCRFEDKSSDNPEYSSFKHTLSISPRKYLQNKNKYNTSR